MLQFNEFTSPFSEGGKTGNSNLCKSIHMFCAGSSCKPSKLNDLVVSFNMLCDLQNQPILTCIILSVLFPEKEYSVNLSTPTSPLCK